MPAQRPDGPLPRLLVLVSGIPASGKTTLGRALAEELGLAFVDKDALLESLMDSLGSPTPDARRQLSRAADEILIEQAGALPGAVVASFWRQPGMRSDSGTPSDWIAGRADTTVVEVMCVCPPELAAERFRVRDRHPGHHDRRHEGEDLATSFSEMAAKGSILKGDPIVVDTARPVDVKVVATRVASHAASMALASRA